jgi:hypothetical protein
MPFCSPKKSEREGWRAISSSHGVEAERLDDGRFKYRPLLERVVA